MAKIHSSIEEKFYWKLLKELNFLKEITKRSISKKDNNAVIGKYGESIINEIGTWVSYSMRKSVIKSDKSISFLERYSQIYIKQNTTINY